MTHDEMKKTAQDFCKAIKIFAEKPENLDNFESYLSYCFEAWLATYADTPENLTAEMLFFANMGGE